MKKCSFVIFLFISICVSGQYSFRFTPAYITGLSIGHFGLYSVGLGMGFEPHDHLYLSVDFNVNMPTLGVLAEGDEFTILDSGNDEIAYATGSLKSFGLFYKSAYTFNETTDGSWYVASGMAAKLVKRYLVIDNYNIPDDSDVNAGKYTSSQVVLPVSFYLGYKASSDQTVFSDVYLGLSFNFLSGGMWNEPLEGEYSSDAELNRLSLIFGVSYGFGKAQ